MKLAFASPGWVDEARRVLEDLVSTHGEAGRRFSVCERFTSAPADIAPSGTAALTCQSQAELTYRSLNGSFLSA